MVGFTKNCTSYCANKKVKKIVLDSFAIDVKLSNIDCIARLRRHFFAKQDLKKVPGSEIPGTFYLK
jgi:hypothetical protein